MIDVIVSDMKATQVYLRVHSYFSAKSSAATRMKTATHIVMTSADSHAISRLIINELDPRHIPYQLLPPQASEHDRP